MIPDRAPTKCWVLKRDDFYPIVTTGADDVIVIDGGVGQGAITVTRRDARLLVKRIIQCIEDTNR